MPFAIFRIARISVHFTKHTKSLPKERRLAIWSTVISVCVSANQLMRYTRRKITKTGLDGIYQTIIWIMGHQAEPLWASSTACSA